MTRSDRRDFFRGLSFIWPWIIGFTLFTLLPAGLSFYYSLCHYSVLQGAVFRGLGNYRELLHDQVFAQSLRNTLYYASMALPGGLVVSLALALALNLSVRFQALYRTVIFLPALVPAVASSMLWLSLLNPRWGILVEMLDTLQRAAGRIHAAWLQRLLERALAACPHWLDDARWAMPALAFMSLWSVGYTVVIFLAGLQDVPRHLYEAADIDGAGTWRRLWHVTLPTLSPVIFFNLIVAVIGVFQTFTVPYNITHGGPKRATYFFAMYLYDNAFMYQRMGYASAMAWVQLAIVLVLTALAFSTSKRWVHYQTR